MLSSSILGPALGGALAQPSQNFPAFFPRGTLFDRYPFLLPNLVCAVVLAFGVLIGILFLEETHAEQKYRGDLGLETGRWLLNRFNNRPATACAGKASQVQIDDYQMLAEDEPPPGYRTTEGSPHLPSSRSQSPGATQASLKFSSGRVLSNAPRGVKKAFTRQVILNIVGFGILA